MVEKTLRFLTAAGCAALILCSGCTPSWRQNDAVAGTVKMDGAPLAGVLVQFVPTDATSQGPSSSGYTDDKGRYELKCDNKKGGAVLGKHNVVVLQGRNDAGDRPAGAAVPPAYTVAAKTPLQVEVTAGEHTYDLNLSRNPPPRK